MIEISVTGKYARGRVTVIDENDWLLVKDYVWWCSPQDYAKTTYVTDGNQPRHISMHRLILGALDNPLQVDHINRDRLDNRRKNLRLVTQTVNLQNTSSKGGRSIYRGVYWEPSKERWRARVMLDGKKHSLGYFHTESEAALAVEAFRAARMPWVSPDPKLPASPSDPIPSIARQDAA